LRECNQIGLTDVTLSVKTVIKLDTTVLDIKIQCTKHDLYTLVNSYLCPIHTTDADETKLSSRVASAV